MVGGGDFGDLPHPWTELSASFRAILAPLPCLFRGRALRYIGLSSVPDSGWVRAYRNSIGLENEDAKDGMLSLLVLGWVSNVDFL